jgi:hypothetical protein
MFAFCQVVGETPGSQIPPMQLDVEAFRAVGMLIGDAAGTFHNNVVNGRSPTRDSPTPR